MKKNNNEEWHHMTIPQYDTTILLWINITYFDVVPSQSHNKRITFNLTIDLLWSSPEMWGQGSVWVPCGIFLRCLDCAYRSGSNQHRVLFTGKSWDFDVMMWSEIEDQNQINEEFSSLTNDTFVSPSGSPSYLYITKLQFGLISIPMDSNPGTERSCYEPR